MSHMKHSIFNKIYAGLLRTKTAPTFPRDLINTNVCIHFLRASCLFASLTYFSKLIRLFPRLRSCRFFQHRPVWSGHPSIFSTPSGVSGVLHLYTFNFFTFAGVDFSPYASAAFRSCFACVCLSVSFRLCFKLLVQSYKEKSK